MRLIESTIASNPADGAPTVEVFESTARAYFAFIDFSNKELVWPDVGTQLRVTLLDYAQALADDNSEDEHNGEDGEDYTEEDRDHTEVDGGQLVPAELGDEDEHDVFELDHEDTLTALPHEWSATVIDPTAITPPGSLTLMLERCRDPTYEGRRLERPFVNFTLLTVNFRVVQSEEDLADRLITAPTIRVAVKMTYSRQGFMDQVRCADELWRSEIN
jgi:hypothetical protein